MITCNLEVTISSVLLVEVDVSGLPANKVEEYLAKVKVQWQEVFQNNPIMVVPLGRFRVSAITQ